MSRAAIVLTVVVGGVGTGFGGVFGGGVAFAGPATMPVNVTCGEVVTTSITVANDLTCPGDALSVEADGVTLDLGGHTVSGSGSGVGIQVTAPDENPEISNVTITNGKIEHFGSAVLLVNAIDPTLSHLNVTQNDGTTRPVIDTGKYTITNGLLITDSSITKSTGYVMFGQVQLGAMTVSSTHFSGGKLFLSQTVGPTFTDDTFANTPLTLDVEGNTTITGSKFTDSPVLNDGFGFGNDVFQNDKFSGAATALTLQDVANQQIIDSTFTGNDIGVSLSDSPGDTLSGNTFNHNSTAGAYFVDNSGPMGSGSLSVTNNTAKYNGTSPDGLLDPDGVAVEGGIYLYTPHGGATITGNKTAHNGGYGIYARPPMPGSGTNTSSGNVSIDDFGKCYPLNTCTY